MWRAVALTLFPEMFPGPLGASLAGRALAERVWSLQAVDIRRFARDRHGTVDDAPFGGGAGMVLKPEPIFECLDLHGISSHEDRLRGEASETVVLLSPQGKLFTQSLAQRMMQCERVVLICGRYEGVDERVSKHLADCEISVGDFVLSGGELGAAIIVDTMARLVPGVLGNTASAQQESFTTMKDRAPTEGEPPSSTCSSGGLLDYPHYTRPAEFRGMTVPEVLVNGNHDEIRRWRRRRALEKTLRNRPDLLRDAELSREDRRLLNEVEAEWEAARE